MGAGESTRVGVLALQGDFREHIAMLQRLGAEAVEVRLPEDLEDIDALVIPGGESTTIGRLAELYGLMEPMRDRIAGGLPALGTCAGMILMGSSTTGDDQPLLGVLDVIVERNAFGRQIDSFEEDLEVTGLEGTVRAVYIRAPWIEKVGDGVTVLARSAEHPVMVQQDNILATAFHPELTDDDRIHRLLLDLAEG